MNVTMMGLILLAGLNVNPGAHLLLDKGSVACRSKAALETMQEAGGFDKLPEFLIGTACFKLHSPLRGEVKSIADSGAVEIAARQRRSITQPPSLWVAEPEQPND